MLMKKLWIITERPDEVKIISRRLKITIGRRKCLEFRLTAKSIIRLFMNLILGSIIPAVAGPKRPQDRIDLDKFKQTFADLFSQPVADGGFGKDADQLDRLNFPYRM